MKHDIYEKEYISKLNILYSIIKNDNNANNELSIINNLYQNVLYTNSGRVSLRIILEYFKSIKRIENKNSEVLVPKWICTGVINTMQKICFPSLSVSKDTKGIMVYHQYGFPQKMDEIMEVANFNNWFVIENCVNVVESYYNDKLIGTYGDASIFSLAKMYSVHQAGALVSNNFDLLSYAENKIKIGNNKWINNFWYLTRVFRSLDDKSGLFWPYLQEMAESLSEKATTINSISKNILINESKLNKLDVRKSNYLYFLNYFRNYEFTVCLEKNCIPYVVPLIDHIDVLNKIKISLLKSKIWTDIYFFDTNRNLLNPNFEKCVWIPIHQGITIDQMDLICKSIESVYVN